jgi:tRNA-dihydrouridine synthase
MSNFWDELPRPFFALAPMEDVTDVVFRRVVARAGRPDAYFTEFMNVDGFLNPQGRSSVARRLVFQPSEQPIVAQIWGSDPEKFMHTAREISRMGFAGIDINMGCPDKKVVKSGGGSALITNHFARPGLAREIVAASKTGGLPVSVKTRLGYSKIDEWQAWLTMLLEQNLANLTVHLRTKREMSKVPAHHELIPEIVALRDQIAPATRLTVNGDIANRLQGLTLQEKCPGVDGLMIGRGVFMNPFCFTDNENPSRAQLFDLLKFHLDLFDAFNVPGEKLPNDFSSPRNASSDSRGATSPCLIGGDSVAPATPLTHFRGKGSEKVFGNFSSNTSPRKFDPLKRFFKVYIKDFAGAAELRAELFNCKTTDEVRQILASTHF